MITRLCQRNRWYTSLLAAGLLVASTNSVLAQLCVCAEPGWMTCSLLGFQSHEPATSAFPQCMAQPEEKSPPMEQEEEQAPPPQRQQRVAPAQQERQAAPPPQEKPRQAAAPRLVNPRAQHQIQPLNCPRGFAKSGETFYGGTKCAPVSRGSVVAGGQSGPPKPVRKPDSVFRRICRGNDGVLEDCSPLASPERFGSAADIARARPNQQGANAGTANLPLIVAAEQLPWDWLARMEPLLRDAASKGSPSGQAAGTSKPTPSSQPAPAPTQPEQPAPPVQGSPPAASLPAASPPAQAAQSGQPTTPSQPAPFDVNRVDIQQLNDQELQALYFITDLVRAQTGNDRTGRVHWADIRREMLLKALAERANKQVPPKPQDPSLGINPW